MGVLFLFFRKVGFRFCFGVFLVVVVIVVLFFGVFFLFVFLFLTLVNVPMYQRQLFSFWGRLSQNFVLFKILLPKGHEKKNPNIYFTPAMY